MRTLLLMLSARGLPKHRPSKHLTQCSMMRLRSLVNVLAIALAATGGGTLAGAQATVLRSDTTQPLGTFQNPVLSRGPAGQAEYIARMRCPDGASVRVMGRGSRGGGPHGHIIDGYQLRCETLGTNHQVYIDVYHGEGDRERRAVAPFTVLQEHPARLAAGCPPRVVPDADSSARYVFIWWEVEKPARLTAPLTPISWPRAGVVSLAFVVDTMGAIEPGSVRPSATPDTAMQRVASERLPTLRFEPAEHRPGCRVRQRASASFTFGPP